MIIRAEKKKKLVSSEEHKIWKGEMLRLQRKKVADNDAILVLNMNKMVKKTILVVQHFWRYIWHLNLVKSIFI